MEIERRHFALECRLEPQGADTVRLRGLAVPFDTWQTIGVDLFAERVNKGAFSTTLKDDDQVLLLSHAGEPIARRSTGTLELVEGKSGLELSAELDTRDGDSQKAAIKVERGDYGGLSIGFAVREEKWEEEEGKMPRRTIERAQLREVSLVAFPAYTDTSVALRSLQAHQGEYNSHFDTDRRLRLSLLSHYKLRYTL